MNKTIAILCWILACVPAVGILVYDIPAPEPASVAVWIMLMSMLGGAWWCK